MHDVRNIYVGMNGGHHRSTAVAYEPDTSRTFSVRGAPVNCHSSASDHACGRLSDLLSDLFDECGTPRDIIRVDRLILAVPGAINFQEERDRGIHQNLATLLDANDVISHWEVVDDTWAGLYAETGMPAGICAYASAGTSVCIAPGEFSTDKKFKIDGWGPVIGDFGSSFDITVDFFRQLGRRLDRGEESRLFDSVKKYVNNHETYTMARKAKAKLPTLTGVKDVQNWFDILCRRFQNGEWRSVLAEIAAPILAFADQASPDNSEAVDIVEENARRFADSILIATARYDELPVVLQGGVVRNCRTYRDAVLKRLGDEGVTATLARVKPAVGALMLAVDGLSDESGVWKLTTSEPNGSTVRDHVFQCESLEVGGHLTHG